MISALGLQAADDAAPTPAAGKTNAPAAVKKEEGKKEEEKKAVATIPDAAHKPVLVTNTVTVAGEAVTYVAETAMLPLLKPDGTVRASVFYVAYRRQGETNAASRPVTFCFNGGPGSSLSLIHISSRPPGNTPARFESVRRRSTSRHQD